jgi:hypothetical protein
MLNMLAVTSVNELMNKVLTILSPVLITIGGVSSVILIGVYAIRGKFSPDAANRKETIKIFLWILGLFMVLILSGTIVWVFKDMWVPIAGQAV